MAGISVRNLDDDIAAGLRLRAATNGRSMEAEVRAILTAAVTEGDDRHNLALAMRERFASFDDIDLDIPPRTDLPRSPDLSGTP